MMKTGMQVSQIRELSLGEIEQVNGGILPLVVAIVAIDAGLIGSMISSGMWDYR